MESLPDLYEASIAELQNGLENGLFSSVDLVKAYFARIDEVNIHGPALHAVIETNPSALEQAADLDRERIVSGARGPLHGIPILLKDNIATSPINEPMNTTAGSLALLGSIPPRDATVAAKLRAAGAIFLGKANMTSWAHFRGGDGTVCGWSARGGQATSPYYPLGDPSSSSSGSAIAVAIGLAAAALGTETTGSIVLPSSRNNGVGIKPTVGLTSRDGVVIPISSHQDSVGPMARTVADAAAVLTVISEPMEKDTHGHPGKAADWCAALRRDALRGVRLGVPRKLQGDDAAIVAEFDKALAIIRDLGATIVDPADLPDTDELFASRAKNESIVLHADFKVELEQYLQSLEHVPTGVRTLADVIAFDRAHPDQELTPPFHTSQSDFIHAENSARDDAYFAALIDNLDMGRARGIDAALSEFNLDALVCPTDGLITDVTGVSGYPIITVPLGFQPDDISPTPADPVIARSPGFPFGIAFVGTAYSESSLISFAHAYEQATHVRLKRLAFAEAIPRTQLGDVVEK
ncbi:amidase signature enzyme [Artomyces pyxidatus]|uniref:Amidase signature enzyme n=1 Tax=Artomyces pyxidatus TaxID=48021 RepID=A0ACB8T1V6_9AGAM|nr:amidase signature enzyme [Artomyces pyxidatus]